jgi:hypothetical protein
VKRIDKNSFEITHTLNHEIVKFRVQKVYPSIREVISVNGESQFVDAEPYLKYKLMPWIPKISTATIFYSDGTSEYVLCK